MRYLIYAILTASSVATGLNYAYELYATAHAKLVHVEQIRDAATIDAAKYADMLYNKKDSTTDDVNALIADKYISDDYTTKEKVGELQLSKEDIQAAAELNNK